MCMHALPTFLQFHTHLGGSIPLHTITNKHITNSVPFHALHAFGVKVRVPVVLIDVVEYILVPNSVFLHFPLAGYILTSGKSTCLP